MSNSTRPSLSKAEKSLYATSILAILVFGGFALLTGNRNNDVVINYPAVAARPNPNGYDFYVAAARATARIAPEHDPASDTIPLIVGSPQYKQRYSVVRRRIWLQKNGKMRALFLKAQRTSTMSPDMRKNYSKTITEFSILRQLTRDNSSIARALQMEHRPFEATQTAFDGIKMGNDIAKNGIIINRLVGIAITAISRAILEDSNVTINQLNVKEAKMAATRLEKLIAEQPKYLDILKEQRWSSLRQFELRSKKPDWRKLKPEATWSQRLSAQIVGKQEIVDNINRTFDEAIARSKLPYSQRKTPLIKIKDALSPSFLPEGLDRTQMNEARANVGLDLLLLRLALRAYRLDNGAYPKTLAALAPKYLKTIPTDDYGDDKPYFYRLKNGAYELWSVGSDGKNDNGKPLTSNYANPSGQVTDLFQKGGDYVAGKNR